MVWERMRNGIRPSLTLDAYWVAVILIIISRSFKNNLD